MVCMRCLAEGKGLPQAGPPGRRSRGGVSPIANEAVTIVGGDALCLEHAAAAAAQGPAEEGD